MKIRIKNPGKHLIRVHRVDGVDYKFVRATLDDPLICHDVPNDAAAVLLSPRMSNIFEAAEPVAEFARPTRGPTLAEQQAAVAARQAQIDEANARAAREQQEAADAQATADREAAEAAAAKAEADAFEREQAEARAKLEAAAKAEAEKPATGKNKGK